MLAATQIWLKCMRSDWFDCIEMDQLEAKSSISAICP